MQLELEKKIVGVSLKNVNSLSKLFSKHEELSLTLKENSNNVFEDMILQILLCPNLKNLLISISGMGINSQRLYQVFEDIQKSCSQITSKYFSRLEHIFLDFYRNPLGKGEGICNIAKILSFFLLKTLSLNLNNCSIHPKGLKSFFDVLTFSQSGLTALKVIFNEQVQTQGVWCFFGQIGTLENLEELDIRFGGGKIDGPSVQSLGFSLKKLKKIKILQLNFYDNSINNKGFVNICSAIKQMNELKELFLDFSANEHLTDINACLQSFYSKKLQSLSLNFIGNQIEKASIKSLSRQSELLRLNLKLANNNLFPIFCFDLFDAMKQWEKLIDLRIWIYYNDKLDQLFFELLCKSLKYFLSIKNLQIFMNQNIKEKTRIYSPSLIDQLICIEKMEIRFGSKQTQFDQIYSAKMRYYITEMHLMKLKIIASEKQQIHYYWIHQYF